MAETRTRNCTTCGRSAASPWREFNADGTVRFGCVDAAHDGHADEWHLRPEAAQLRRATVDRLAS
jgi:lysyl-tRNA synthetase class I